MDKALLKKAAGAVLVIAAVLCFIGAVTVEGGEGTLDFSGVIKVLLCAVAVLLLLIASHLVSVKSEKGKKIKSALLVSLVTLIILGAAIDNRIESMGGAEYIHIDLDAAVTAELHAYDNVSEEPAAKVTLTDSADVSALAAHFSSLNLQPLRQVDPCILGYVIRFFDGEGDVIANLQLPYGPTPWVGYNGGLYAPEGAAVDTQLLARLAGMEG